MAKQCHLPNAPITEALLHFQVRFDTPPKGGVLEAVANSIKKELPLVEKRQKATFSFSLAADQSDHNVETEPDGFLARSNDRTYAAQIMRESFTFSRLAPYEDWETLYREAMRIWSIYAEITQPVRIVRVAVRYINKLMLPMPLTDFGDYFTKPIDIPAELPQGLANYMLRYVLPDPGTNMIATVHQVFDGEIVNNQLSVIFDIDAFKAVDFEVSDNEEISSTLEGLREYTNLIFFSNLTERAIGLYK